MHVSAVAGEARRKYQILGTGVTGSCEPPDVSVGDRTWFSANTVHGSF